MVSSTVLSKPGVWYQQLETLTLKSYAFYPFQTSRWSFFFCNRYFTCVFLYLVLISSWRFFYWCLDFKTRMSLHSLFISVKVRTFFSTFFIWCLIETLFIIYYKKSFFHLPRISFVTLLSSLTLVIFIIFNKNPDLFITSVYIFSLFP